MELVVILIIIVLCIAYRRKKGKRIKLKKRDWQTTGKVISGYEFLATLDFHTCLVCGILDGRRYKRKADIPRCIHAGCRCVVIPVTPLSDFIEEERPMANADFDFEAKQMYEKKYPNKNFDILKESTKKKYYYQAIAAYEQRTGRKPFSFSSRNFREWFYALPKQYQQHYLGQERYQIFQRYHLKLEDFVDIRNFREYSLNELRTKNLSLNNSKFSINYNRCGKG